MKQWMKERSEGRRNKAKEDTRKQRKKE